MRYGIKQYITNSKDCCSTLFNVAFSRSKNNAESTDILIIGEIGSDYSVDDLKKDLKNCKKTINMYISSGGGNVFSGWAMTIS
jgi:ATP-dependent protease ClpP protease subunit